MGSMMSHAWAEATTHESSQDLVFFSPNCMAYVITWR